ncbi:MAG: hypothetical protein R3E01_25470 [Pirellulaceae bacterium]
MGIFYFLWHGQHEPAGMGPFDVSHVLAAHPDALNTDTSPPWGPTGVPHYWSEPLFGYYRAGDPWVLRRHAQLLSAAGVDTLIFDTTNRVTYLDVVEQLGKVFTEVRAAGGTTPQFAFMVNTRAGETAEELYERIYLPGRFPDLWFQWQGKPLLICDPAEASEPVRRFFTLRKAHWPFEMKNTPYAWHWEATYPQPYGYTDDAEIPEQVNVSVAQNLRASDGKVTNMSNLDARGRSFHDGAMDAQADAIDRGTNFAEQWQRAHQLQPPVVMVTGWNEWIAGRQPSPGRATFVDQFDRQFSRDIEMMKGGHRDNYYYQLVDGIRRYKGAPDLPLASAATTIDINAGVEQWKDILPEYLDLRGDTAPRDYPGIGALHYSNSSGRNDFVSMKVTRDRQHLYFLAQTAADITSPDDDAWMLLFIDADDDRDTGWLGYDYVVNRALVDDGKTTHLERLHADGTSEVVAKLPLTVRSDHLQLAIPRAALGLPNGDERVTVSFKWCDHVGNPSVAWPFDPMALYTDGDVAPEGRFRFVYRTDQR